MNVDVVGSGHNICSNGLYENDFPRNQDAGDVAPKYFAMGDIKKDPTFNQRKKKLKSNKFKRNKVLCIIQFKNLKKPSKCNGAIKNKYTK